MNIIDKGHLYPSETSGGMQKRIAIARAIAMQPEYLFADEPNSGLDPQTAIVIDNLIKEITEESTLSHHIKNFTEENISPLKNVIGFTLSKNA